jgi:serine/threonine protein kinase
MTGWPRLDVLAQGSRLGRYEILGRIAVGGMAEIYLAGLAGFQRLVVIKRMLPGFMDSDEYVRMFLDEAHLAARLRHPNIVEVHDIDQADGQHYYAMEYVHGESVQRLLAACRQARRQLDYAQAIAIVTGVAAALHHAHEARGEDGAPLGIVHRDVSPSNILVTHDGGVKLLDFGVAKARVRHALTTRKGTLKGKIAYMSPEQCRGDAVDRRSDVFSMGAVLYELTTGVRPFEADTDLGVVERVRAAAPIPPLLVRGGYPEGLERIVLRALARAPEERHATADELRRDLEAFLRDEGLAAPLLGELLRDTLGEPDDEPSFSLSIRRPSPCSMTPAPEATVAPPARSRARPASVLALVALLAFVMLIGAAIVRHTPPAAAQVPIIPIPLPVPVPR